MIHGLHEKDNYQKSAPYPIMQYMHCIVEEGHMEVYMYVSKSC